MVVERKEKERGGGGRVEILQVKEGGGWLFFLVTSRQSNLYPLICCRVSFLYDLVEGADVGHLF